MTRPACRCLSYGRLMKAGFLISWRGDFDMGMKSIEIEKLIRDAFPDADIEIKDLAGDENHYAATVTSAAFQGKNRVAQHQLVYAALKGNMGGVLHALQLQTVAKG